MNELNYTLIGEKIRKRRKDLRMTQEQVAARLEVNPSHISNIECGRANPSLTALVNIANVLSCSVDCFLDAEYTFVEPSSTTVALDHEIQKKLRYKSRSEKERLLKMMDLL